MNAGAIIRVVMHARIKGVSDSGHFVVTVPGHSGYKFLVRPEDINDADGVMIQEPICEYCLEPYRPRQPHQRFCCSQHRKLWHYEQGKRELEPEPDLQPCARDGCDVTFKPSRYDHIYCSDDCRKAVKRARENGGAS